MKKFVFGLLIGLAAAVSCAAQTPVPTPTPAKLPEDVPPIAPDFRAPVRPLPSVERVGVDVANQLPLSLNDAIRLALQNNNDIETAKKDVEIAEFNLRGADGVYAPAFVSDSFYERRTTPTASVIGGAVNGAVTNSTLTSTAGISGLTRRGGGSYNLGFTSSRTNTSNLNATLNPQFPSSLSFIYVQPLMRGRRIDNNRRTIEIAKKSLSITDQQFRQRAVEVIAGVEQAYWDLAYGLRNLQVQIDAVKQARVQLESNQRLVAKGVLAPIDIVATNAQITTFEQGVYSAQEVVTAAENRLKTLMLPNRGNDIWSRALVPVSPIELDVPRVPLEKAVDTALNNRQEIAQLKTSAEINKINERYYRDQTKPQIDLTGTYSSSGLAGATTAASINPTTGLSRVPDNLIGGYFNSVGNLIQQDYPTYRVGLTITLPFGNRIARANLGRTLVEGSQIETSTAQIEQAIEADVRNALQSLRSAEARLQAAAATRSSAEQLFESEERQFRAGTTTVFLVFQRQKDLIDARGKELQAQTDLNKAISNFQRAIGTTLEANSVEITKEITPSRFIIRNPNDFGSRVFTADTK
ncbi:MAG TPA: TolC family protein [Pyrinomonadaceae bacterium]|nr:TolC family protein [Pyrinomonadaceae bacterium]